MQTTVDVYEIQRTRTKVAANWLNPNWLNWVNPPYSKNMHVMWPVDFQKDTFFKTMFASIINTLHMQ